MGAAASTLTSVEEARAAGFTEEQIAEYNKKTAEAAAAAAAPDETTASTAAAVSEPACGADDAAAAPTPDAVRTLDAAETPAAALTPETEDDEEPLPVLTVVAPGVKVSKEGAVMVLPGSNLGMLHTALLRHLLQPLAPASTSRPLAKWQWRRTPGLKWNLMLSEAQGQSIPWKKMHAVAGDWSARGDAAPIVNFSRGFQSLCRKAMLVVRGQRRALPAAAGGERRASAACRRGEKHQLLPPLVF